MCEDFQKADKHTRASTDNAVGFIMVYPDFKEPFSHKIINTDDKCDAFLACWAQYIFWAAQHSDDRGMGCKCVFQRIARIWGVMITFSGKPLHKAGN